MPEANFARGIRGIDEVPGFGPPTTRGKVRDMWKVGDRRIIVTTDRQSAFDSVLATVPDKGKVLNLLSAHWFRETADIVPNHLVAITHPNIMVVREVENRLPIEVIIRDYMSKSSSPTSVWTHYGRGERRIYGIEFPDGLRPNQKLPMGTIVTPTTKESEDSPHDLPLTEAEAKSIADEEFGGGTWDRVSIVAREVFERGRRTLWKAGFILADTKFEFGFDKNGRLIMIDELFTPDSSRIWRRGTYQERFDNGIDPENLDKETLRDWLASHGFNGEEGQQIPVINPAVIDLLSESYKTAFREITKKELPVQASEITEAVAEAIVNT